MKGISRTFPGVIALDNVDFDLMEAEIHALLGENGAGKRTLMKILFGILKPDSGEIYIKGNRASIRSPNDARRFGIGMVHQHFMLVESLTVLENIALSHNEGSLIAHREIETRIKEISRLYNLSVDPNNKIWQLSVGEQQRVEIIKALYGDVKILILDEPTSVLTPLEVEDLSKALRSMKGRAKSVVFITHKLDEVMSIADRVTVLRKGNVAGVIRPDQTTKSELVRMMIGGDVSETANRSERKEAEFSEAPLLRVEDLAVLNDKGLETLHGISFKVNGGEILGVAGVAGNGQKEMAEALTGARRAKRGKIRFLGRDITGRKTREIIDMGISSVPEN